MERCRWAEVNERNRIYHDTEWGVPVHDDRTMFEHLCMESLQCGLSWDLMLKKREAFRKCFCDFDFEKTALLTEADVEKMLEVDGMLKSVGKIRAIIHNAQCFLKVREEFGSFCDYIWGFTDGMSIRYEGHGKTREDGSLIIPVSNDLSLRISKDLKKRGFKYVGPVTIYSHLQACGIINDHEEDCPCYQKIRAAHPTADRKPDGDVF